MIIFFFVPEKNIMFEANIFLDRFTFLPNIAQGNALAAIDNIFENEFELIFPEIFFLIAITLLLLYGVIYSPMRDYKFPILTQTIG